MQIEYKKDLVRKTGQEAVYRVGQRPIVLATGEAGPGELQMGLGGREEAQTGEDEWAALKYYNDQLGELVTGD